MDTPLILVGTNDGFEAVGDDLPRMPLGHAMTHAVVGDDGIWAIGDARTVWHDPGRGEGTPVASLDGHRANCLAVRGSDVFVGGTEASLFRLHGAELVRAASFDEAPGRSSWFTPWGGPPDVRSMAVGADGELFVNVHVGGVLRSFDSGETWQPTLDIDADVHEVTSDGDGAVFVAAAVGLGISKDRGHTWSFETSGMHDTYCRAVAVSDAHVFVSASTGSRGGHAALYRRPRAGGDLQRCGNGLPQWFSTNLDTFCLAAKGSTVAAGDDNGTIYVSRDDGAQWDVVAERLPGVNCVVVL